MAAEAPICSDGDHNLRHEIALLVEIQKILARIQNFVAPGKVDALDMASLQGLRERMDELAGRRDNSSVQVVKEHPQLKMQLDQERAKTVGMAKVARSQFNFWNRCLDVIGSERSDFLTKDTYSKNGQLTN